MLLYYHPQNTFYFVIKLQPKMENLVNECPDGGQQEVVGSNPTAWTFCIFTKKGKGRGMGIEPGSVGAKRMGFSKSR